MPRFSILIPTRNRPETLRACLRTCLAQRFDDFEVIVSNNSDVLREETNRAVAEFQSPRIGIVHPEHPLSMTDNWEFALSHASGDYVLVLGDDDGLALHALHELDRLLKLTSAAVVSWEYASYVWPNMPPQFAYRINIPLGQRTFWRKGISVIQNVIRFKERYFALPMLYNSAVNRSLLTRIADRNGRFFFGASPDIYSGIAIAYSVDRYVRSEIPFTVGGTSAKSNGFATVHGGDSAIEADFHSLNRQHASSHSQLPSPSLISAYIYDSLNWAKEKLIPRAPFPRMNNRDLLFACLQELPSLHRERAAQALKDLEDFFSGSKTSLAQISQARSKLEKVNSSISRREYAESPRKTFFDGDRLLLLDGEFFNVADIHDAAQLVEHLLGYQLNGIDWNRLLNAQSASYRLHSLIRRIQSRLSRVCYRYT